MLFRSRWIDKSVYQGEWKDGIQNGFGKMIFPNGKIKEGLFEKNSYIRKCNVSEIPNAFKNSGFDIFQLAPQNIDFSEAKNVINTLNINMNLNNKEELHQKMNNFNFKGFNKTLKMKSIKKSNAKIDNDINHNVFQKKYFNLNNPNKDKNNYIEKEDGEKGIEKSIEKEKDKDKEKEKMLDFTKFNRSGDCHVIKKINILSNVKVDNLGQNYFSLDKSLNSSNDSMLITNNINNNYCPEINKTQASHINNISNYIISGMISPFQCVKRCKQCYLKDSKRKCKSLTKSRINPSSFHKRQIKEIVNLI